MINAAYPFCIGTQLEAENEVNNEMANRMSLFYAEATPMLKTLSNATTKFVSEVDFQLFREQIHIEVYCIETLVNTKSGHFHN